MNKNLKNYEYFQSNFDSLYKEYKNKFIVIKDENVVGSFNSFNEAYSEASSKYELGTFLIQQCVKLNNENIHKFHSFQFVE